MSVMVTVPVTEINQWIYSQVDLECDPYADSETSHNVLANLTMEICDVKFEKDGHYVDCPDEATCITVSFTDFDDVGFPPDHVLVVLLPDGPVIYPCADWGGTGPKPIADSWLWQTGDCWVAGRRDWEETTWWEDTDPEDIAARPEIWLRELNDIPTTGDLRFCVDENIEIVMSAEILQEQSYKQTLQDLQQQINIERNS